MAGRARRGARGGPARAGRGDRVGAVELDGREALLDPSVPVLFTEGAPKADVAAGLGYCAVDVFGVHNWYANPKHGGFDHLPLDQWKSLNKNLDWTAIHLWRNGERIEANARHCPETMAVLEAVPQPQVLGAGPNAMFSLLAPNTRIPPHVGVSNARLVCHLPLVVPEGCWFRVGAETRLWKRGEAFVFDDTIEHEAMNPSDELRVVFIFDLWHPDLSATERQAVRALIEADGGAGEGL